MPSDVRIDDGGVTVTSGLYDTDDGITLQVQGEDHPRLRLTPQGDIQRGDGSSAAVGTPFRYFALQVVNDTPTDGTADPVVVRTFEGPVSFGTGEGDFPLALLEGRVVGFDHSSIDGGLYVFHETDDWEPLPLVIGDLIKFTGVGETGWGFGQAGPDEDPLQQPVRGAVATQVNVDNLKADRVFIYNHVPTNYTPTTTPEDPGGITLDQHLRGIDAALGTLLAALP